MRVIFSRHVSPFAPTAVILSLVTALAPTSPALADGLLGLYAGGSVGQSRVEANAPGYGGFGENHSAFKLMAGLRPISLIGAELSYIDFGHPSGRIDTLPSDVAEKGAAAFGVFYLPVPVVDVFLKAGLARLQSTLDLTRIGSALCVISVPDCALLRLERTNTSFAAGAGFQVKLGSLAARAEYERFTAAGGNPSLVSLGLTWTF